MPEKEIKVKKEEMPVEEIKVKKEEKPMEMVTGIFSHCEEKGATLKLTKHSVTLPDYEKSFKDGEVYTVPKEIADHLNKNCWVPIYGWGEDENGSQVQVMTGKTYRFSFLPVRE